MKLPFGRSTPRNDPGGEQGEEFWALADMECVQDPEARDERDSVPSFSYEDAKVHPAGEFTAQLVGWRALDTQHAVWTFRSDRQETPPLAIPYVTGRVCRPDNNLCRLMAALGAAPDAGTGGDLSAFRAAMVEAAKALDPDSLVGKRCRIQVEHTRDDLGDVTAHIRTVAPLDVV